MNIDRLTISPINKNLKSKSNIDFREQWMRTRTGELKWCWDDSKFNNSKPGDYFGFMFYGIKVKIHRILAVKPTSERLPSWSSNVGQSDRNVLELSELVKEITWEEWIANDGPKKRQCTYTTKDLSKNRKKLFIILNTTNNSNKDLSISEINGRESLLDEIETLVDEREKALEEREKALQEREKALEEREKALENLKNLLINI
jgi:hypothetical protein